MPKVFFGLKNAHYAVVESVDEVGVVTYGTPVPFGCAVSLSITASGEQTKFYCDDKVHYTATSNQGYEGSAEVAKVSQTFRVDVLGEQIDDNGVLLEQSSAIPKSFALLFEVDGVDDSDTQERTRYVLYNCQATRPSSDHATKTESTEPGTQTLEFTATPRPDEVIKAEVSETTTAVYANWFSAVYEPVLTAG